ncbi:MAG: DUF4160 domain-containing protein [Oscillospiraceae bacterium]|nr:DUF4160 domain-containing protein [Oscillospiraceae bacterium]
MPKLFRTGQYVIFFWLNENDEPVRVHIGIVNPSPNATKIWLTKGGGCIAANNKSRIPQKDLNELMGIIQDNFFYICSKWKEYFRTDTIKFYC